MVHLVDDDDAVRDSLKTLLESYGMEVRDYKSAVEFLEQTGNSVGGCLVLDLHLPVLSGLNLLTIMRQRDMALPVVFITGRSDRETKERAIKAGAVAFLDKPVGETALMAAIDAALARDARPLTRVGAGAPLGVGLEHQPLLPS
jgi:two-component system response regulator FixJ